MPFLTALMVRDEAGRYLKEVLDHHAAFGPLLILDDGSTDGSSEIIASHPAVIYQERVESEGIWGRESPLRERLWMLASELAEWVLVADADQLFIGDPRELTQSPLVNCWAFVLYDLWDDRTHYRDDGYWRGHDYPRPWLFNPHRVPGEWRAEWSKRGVHPGHCPANFPALMGYAPKERYRWLHLGYLRPEDRAEKLARYRAVTMQLTDFERLHAESIADPKPTLRVLPSERVTKVLVGGPVRKRLSVLKPFLDSLAWQELPPRTQLSFAFTPDYPYGEDESLAYLDNWTAERGGTLLFPQERPPAGDYSDTDPVTHRWLPTALQRLALMKNELLSLAVKESFDYIWLVDSDLVLDTTVLSCLLATDRLIVSAVYWTRWNKGGEQVIHAAPQVWLKPPYQLHLPTLSEPEFRRRLALGRELVQVGGLGACTLIARSVIEKGVNFSKPPGFPSGGLWDGEDRHFSEWAKRLHVDLYADAWPDILHLYHVEDEERLGLLLPRLSTPHPLRPSWGDLVSLRLVQLEDMAHVGPEFIRCRLGSGKLLPELESAIFSMTRGTSRIVRIHYPVSWPVFAGQSRLVELTLIDTKPISYAPVLEDELYVDGYGNVLDATTMNPVQHDLIAAEAKA